MTPTERFFNKVDITPACWNWMAAKEKGYGRFSVSAGRVIGAHRFSYEIHIGPIPPGMDVDHLCHQPACVNPDHLRAATQGQNQENRRGAQRNSKSGIRGVSWHTASGKWRAQVGHAGKCLYLGLFADLAEAKAAVVAARNELHTHNNTDRLAVPGGDA